MTVKRFVCLVMFCYVLLYMTSSPAASPPHSLHEAASPRSSLEASLVIPLPLPLLYHIGGPLVVDFSNAPSPSTTMPPFVDNAPPPTQPTMASTPLPLLTTMFILALLFSRLLLILRPSKMPFLIE